MRDKNQSNDNMSDHALELIMVDVLDGMLESSLESRILNGSSKPSLLSLVNTGTGKGSPATPTSSNKTTL
jgi:hypothetical protein